MATILEKEVNRILHDCLLTVEDLNLPPEVTDQKTIVSFSPPDAAPFLPTSLKTTESSSALFALLGMFSNAIVADRYHISPQKIDVDVHSATLFLMSAFLFKSQGKPIWDSLLEDRAAPFDYGKIRELYRGRGTGIYKTKDGAYFHLHGSLNTSNTLNMLGLPQHRPDLEHPSKWEECKSIYRAEVVKHDSRWLDIEANEYWRQAGTICYTLEDFQKTPHGQIMTKEPLYNIYRVQDGLPKVEWPPSIDDRRRPLEGIKVLDFSRVIAGPTISRLLSLLGADVLRVSSTKLPDTVLLYDTQIGKRDVSLDLKTAEGKKQARDLLEQADVLLDAFRPGALERLGFGRVEVQEIARRRGKGIVHARENCYGWKGEWSHRSGWQQISDAVTGTTWVQGEYLGLKEPVIPLLPNSDYQTGIVGAIAVCQALFDRAKFGGSYNVDVSLTQYNLWYLSLGLQNQETCDALRLLNAGFTPKHETELTELVTAVKELTKKNLGVGKGKLWDPERFTTGNLRWNGPADESCSFLDWSKIVKFQAEKGRSTEWSHDRGSCIPGSDKPEW